MFSKHLSINAILMLEFVCSSLGIGLTWTTWNEKFNDELKNNIITIRKMIYRLKQSLKLVLPNKYLTPIPLS